MRRYPTVLILTALLGIAACTTNRNDTPVVGSALNDLTGMHDETQNRLGSAANSAIAQGKTKEALVFYSKLYKDDPKNEETALNYAQLLRKSHRTEEAVKILSRFVNGRSGDLKDSARPIMLNEYAAANIELGKYGLAEDALNQVLENKNATHFYPDADNLLGLVLDAKNQHKEAEQYYRQALEGWKGDPSAVMNNLGLCLAAQGNFDSSLTMLRQALLKAPPAQKEEIARNIKMVSDLRQALVPTAPIRVTSPLRNN